jgi:Ca-activated chloride channel family protein
VIAVLIGFYLKYWTKKTYKKIGDYKVFSLLINEVSPVKKAWKSIFFTLGMIFLLLGLANFQYGTKMEEVKSEGIDLILALDISNSMLAEDIQPNRLERAKMAIEQLINKLHGDRIGIVVFAGDAFVQLPVTTDYAAAKLFLEGISTNMVSTQGTAIGTAIELAVESFDYSNETDKAIIVITDGENHEDNAVEAAAMAKEKGITVHTIGMGSEKGGPIPIYRRGKQIGFKTDKENNTVITKLNEQMLKEIAVAGGGIYVRATTANAGLNYILSEINKMQKKEFGSKKVKNYEDRFQLFLAISLLFFILEMLLSNKKSKWAQKLNLFNEQE